MDVFSNCHENLRISAIITLLKTTFYLYLYFELFNLVCVASQTSVKTIQLLDVQKLLFILFIQCSIFVTISLWPVTSVL